MTKELQPWQQAIWDWLKELPLLPDGQVRTWYINRKGNHVYVDTKIRSD